MKVTTEVSTTSHLCEEFNELVDVNDRLRLIKKFIHIRNLAGSQSNEGGQRGLKHVLIATATYHP